MKTTFAALLSLSLSLSAAPAFAQDTTEQAKALFETGAAMYEKAHYDEAIQAFEAAYRIAPRAGIQFSMAQANKKQFLFDKNPDRLRDALKNYREYLQKTPNGGRRAEAIESITELEPYASKIDMSRVSAPAAKRPPRVSVSSSTKGVEAELDGKKAPEVPYFWEVTAGKHKIKLSAPGYYPEEMEIVALDDGIVPVTRDLKEMPARLTITAQVDSQITIDGRLIGTTPLPKPLDVDPGVHLLSLTKSGYKAWSQEIDVKHAETKALSVKLERTNQRVASYVLLLAGAGGVAGGAVFGALAFQQQTLAQNIDNLTKTQNISDAQRSQYNTALDNRELDKKIAGISLGAGGVAAVTGLLLYAFDQPVVGQGPSKRDDRPKEGPAPSTRPRDMEISAMPMFGPNFWGASTTLRF